MKKLASFITYCTMTIGSVLADIVVVNSASVVSPDAGEAKSAVVSFNAGTTANKLIVQVSSEGQAISSITYHGVNLTRAVASVGRNLGIFYLDNPFTGGAANLSVNLGAGTSNGIAVGVVSISGAENGVAATASASSSNSVSLSVPQSGSFVMSGYAANGGGTITLPAGHTEIYNSTNIGSAHAAASYSTGQLSGTQTYTFGDTNISSPATSAAIFSPTNGAPELSSTSPASGLTAVALNANLVATFNETMQKGTGNITIFRSDGTVFETLVVTSTAVTLTGAQVTINPVNNFENGTAYHVLIDPTALRNTTGGFFPGISNPTGWSFTSLVNFTSLPDLATVDGRLTRMMQQNITNPWPATTNAPGMASYALAALNLGTTVVTANDLINQFHGNYPVPDTDTIDFESYFWLHMMWRIYHDPTMNARLTPMARSNILNMMWRWIRSRSKLSDAQRSAWVYHGSENHDAMQKGGFLLCAEALKNAPGYGPNIVLADGGTIAQHAAAWSEYFPRYFVDRAREGINAEIANPTYAKYSVGVYYNIMDFAESPTLRALAKSFIDLYWADSASDWCTSGTRGGGQTRCYKDDYLRLGSTYSFDELLWAYGWHSNVGISRTYSLITSASSYRVPPIITACASGARPNYLYTSRRFGLSGGTLGDDNFIAFDNGNSFIRRDTWVTPDFTMGSMTFDMNRDYVQIIDQNRAMGVMFSTGVNDRVMVFGKGAASDDKSYADLNGITRANCMIVQRDQNANRSGNGTLVFVAQKLWNTRVETGGWLFIRSGNAYCALRPADGTYSAGAAAHGVDLAMSNIWAPVIIQMGQVANYTDFAAFQSSVIANTLTFTSNTLNYTSEAGDVFTVYANSKTTPLVNGSTVNLNPPKAYDSPYLSMVHGSALATVSYPGFADLLLNFGTFSTWISRPEFGLTAADRDLFDDPDGDSIDNGIENFFGTHPGRPTQGLLAVSAGNVNGAFVFTHPQGILAPDLSARYRWSTDLTTFHDGGASSGGTTVNFTIQLNTPVAGTTTVTATATGTNPSRLFFKVEVAKID